MKNQIHPCSILIREVIEEYNHESSNEIYTFYYNYTSFKDWCFF